MLNSINRILKQQAAAKTIWIALSGGMDSHALLHVACQWRNNFPDLIFKAVHIHHGLQKQADEWEAHCQKICDDLKIELIIIRVNVLKKRKHSLEAEARKMRYEAFAKLLKANDILLTAHHQNDQAETCLLQFLRGAGFRGLASMPETFPFAEGYLARPFLSISRDNILQYAQENKLVWVDDPSNQVIDFTRNFLRNRVIPVLKKRWPTVEKTMARVAEHAAETKILLDEMAEEDFKKVRDEQNHLSIIELQKLSLPRQKNILRAWLHQQGFLLPSTKKLQHILKDVIQSRVDAIPCVHWQDIEVRRFKNFLYAMKKINSHDNFMQLSWDGKKSLELPSELGTLTAKKVKGHGLKPPKDLMQIHFRQGGENCHLVNRQGSQALKKLFQEWHIPPWQRDRIPLIFIKNELAMIVGFEICDKFRAKENEEGLEINWLQ